MKTAKLTQLFCQATDAPERQPVTVVLAHIQNIYTDRNPTDTGLREWTHLVLIGPRLIDVEESEADIIRLVEENT